MINLPLKTQEFCGDYFIEDCNDKLVLFAEDGMLSRGELAYIVKAVNLFDDLQNAVQCAFEALHNQKPEEADRDLLAHMRDVVVLLRDS
jgi:hypothetical protein